MPICTISLVDVDRVWFKSRRGISTSEILRGDSFSCNTVLEYSPNVLVVKNAEEDLRFRHNRIINKCSINFYAGAAIMFEGVKIGAFCICDTIPRNDFDQNMENMLLDFASITEEYIKEHKIASVVEALNFPCISVAILSNLNEPLGTVAFDTKRLQNCMKSLSYCGRHSFKADPNYAVNVLKKLEDVALSLSRNIAVLNHAIDISIRFGTAITQRSAGWYNINMRGTINRPDCSANAFFNNLRKSISGINIPNQHQVTWTCSANAATRLLNQELFLDLLMALIGFLSLKIFSRFNDQHVSMSINPVLESSTGKRLKGRMPNGVYFCRGLLKVQVTYLDPIEPLSNEGQDMYFLNFIRDIVEAFHGDFSIKREDQFSGVYRIGLPVILNVSGFAPISPRQRHAASNELKLSHECVSRVSDGALKANSFTLNKDQESTRSVFSDASLASDRSIASQCSSVDTTLPNSSSPSSYESYFRSIHKELVTLSDNQGIHFIRMPEFIRDRSKKLSKDFSAFFGGFNKVMPVSK